MEVQQTNECITISKLWRLNGEPMKFTDFVNLHNENKLDQKYYDVIYKQNQSKSITYTNTTPIVEQPTLNVCKTKEEGNKHSLLKVAALVFIVVGTIYLIKKD